MTSDYACPAPRDSRDRDPASVRRGYGLTMLLLAGVLLLKSLAGPLVLGIVTYPITDTVEYQLIGLELVTATLVAPWAAAAGIAALRGHRAAPIFGFAPAAYAAYMFVQYVLGPEYGAYSLTVLADLAIFVLATGLAAWSWTLAWEVPLARLPRRHAMHSGLLVLAMAAFVLLRYAGVVAGALSGAPLADELLEERTFFWSIFLLDLGVVVPCTVAAGLALIRGTDAGQRALYAVVGWFALVPPSVAAMAAVMWANDDPHGSIPTVALLSVASVAFGVFAWHTFRALLTGPGRVGHYQRSDR
jgi:hypothetical protein